MTLNLETTVPAPVDPSAQQHMVPARDGVELATDVYLPEGEGPWPAVLVRLPYDKNGRYCWMPFIAAHFTGRGYAFAVQDVRGKFRSGGETNAFVHEIADGYDTVDWVAGQPWCNGDVGMWGDSYYGFTQWAAVASGHPALKAIVPRVTVADLFAWLGGVTPLYGAHYLAQYWSDNNSYHWTPDWSHRPLAEMFDDAFEAIGSRSIAFDRLLAESTGQAPVDLYANGHPFDRLRIPTLHGVGWFDNITPPHMRDYDRLMSDPATAPFQYLHAGSTDHENYRFETVPVTDAENHAVNDGALARVMEHYLAPALEFFDAFLAGRTDPATIPRVRWHLAGAGWQESPSWPPTGATERRLYPSGRALGGEPAAAEAIEWIHDPANLVPSTIIDPFSFLLEYPDENAAADRDDLLVFTGPPLEAPLTLAGPVTVHLKVASDGSAMNVHVKLVVVAPDGGAHILLYGQERVERADGSRLVEVPLGHTGHRLAAGNRLRLQVASSDYPLYVPHPGTAESPWFAVDTQPNRQRLLTGGDSGSHLSLTMLPEAL